MSGQKKEFTLLEAMLRHPRWLFWYLVAVFLIGWNGIGFSEAWTKWTVLSFACQLVLVVCAYQVFHRNEDSVRHWISSFFSKFEK